MFKLDPDLRRQHLQEEALAARLEGVNQSNLLALPFGAARIRRVKELRNLQALLLQPSGTDGAAPSVRLLVKERDDGAATSDGPEAA